MLVVDDNSEKRFALGRALTRAGFAVWEAETGEQGIGRAAEDPDLILLDVNLPDLHGFEVCRRIKADPRTAHIPVLHLSQTHVDPAAHARGLESGADAYLSEPVDPVVMIATVRALLRLRRAEDRLRRAVAHAEITDGLTAELASALTPDEVLAAVTRRALAEIGARDATIYLIEPRGRRLELAYTTYRVPTPEEFVSVEVSADFPPAEAARTGEALFGDRSAMVESFPTAADAHADRGGGSWAMIPLTAYGRPLGAMSIAFFADTPVDADVRSLLVTLGERCGQALERAELYEYQRHIATTLQDSLLPAALPVIPGVEIAARYRAGTAAMEVGGDFYDVFPCGDAWLVIIGDVCGRDAEAAALTALARHTIRAFAQHLSRPGELLELLNEAIIAGGAPLGTRLVTAACLFIERDGADVNVTAAVAGHPPPLILRRGGAVEPITTTGPLLGYVEDAEIRETTDRLRVGEGLLLYTDGLTEARRGSDFFGETRLHELLGALTAESSDAVAAGEADAERIADDIVAAVTAHAETLTDDLALLLLCLRSTEGGVGAGIT